MKMAALVCLAFAGILAVCSAANATEPTNSTSSVDTSVNVDDEGDQNLGGGAFGLSWSVASITNKVLIAILVILGLIAVYLVFRYYRIQKRRNRLTRYKRLHEMGGDDEIVVFEKNNE